MELQINHVRINCSRPVDINIYYCLVSSKQSNGSWIPPSDWTGPCAVLYQSFDNSDGFVLMEGTEAASDPVSLVSGKVGHIKFVFMKIISMKSKLW